MRSETQYQARLVKKLQELFPMAFIVRNDPRLNQGVPDILLLIGNSWAMLEVKKSEKEPARPNQPYYVDLFDHMSFGAFIYPENEEQVLNDLQSAFGTSGETCVSESQ